MKANCEKSGGKFIQTDDPYQYIEDVDFIITDAWWYHGSDHLKDKKLDEFFPEYAVNDELIAAAPEWVKVMHPLPGNRGYEVSESVWDGPHSLLIEQAANRFHTQKRLAGYLHVPSRSPAEAGHGGLLHRAGGNGSYAYRGQSGRYSLRRLGSG